MALSREWSSGSLFANAFSSIAEGRLRAIVEKRGLDRRGEDGKIAYRITPVGFDAEAAAFTFRLASILVLHFYGQID